MLNRLASLITERVNVSSTADPRAYPVGRQITCVFHILTPCLCGLSPCAKDTVKILHYQKRKIFFQNSSFLTFSSYLVSSSFKAFSIWVQKWKLWQSEIWFCFIWQQLVMCTFRVPLCSINAFKYLNASWS